MAVLVPSEGQTCDTTQQVPVSVSFSKGGVPIGVDPNVPLVWDVTSGAATVVAAPGDDGTMTKVIFKSADVAGFSQVLMTADAQLGDGTTPLSELFEFTWADALADSVVPIVGTPEPKV